MGGIYLFIVHDEFSARECYCWSTGARKALNGRVGEVNRYIHDNSRPEKPKLMHVTSWNCGRIPLNLGHVQLENEWNWFGNHVPRPFWGRTSQVMEFSASPKSWRMARYEVLVDGVSKSIKAENLRRGKFRKALWSVGWTLGLVAHSSKIWGI